MALTRAVGAVRLVFVAALVAAAVGCGGGGGGGDDDDTPDAREDADIDGSGLPQCADSRDNDGDGKIDYPFDPGCLVPNQDSEGDDCPDGPNCPECGDGEDNDFDGMIDYGGGDTNCTSASDDSELDISAGVCGNGTSVLPLPSSGMVSGTLGTGISNLMPVQCAGAVGTGTEAVYVVTVTEPETLVASTEDPLTTADTVLYLRRACLTSTTELACNNDVSAGSIASNLTVALDPGTYFLVVDARGPATSGGYVLRVTRFPALGEACTSEAECAPAHTCRVPAGGSSMSCEAPVCGDGRDDDADGETDFPDDPGCTSPADDTEADTCPGAGCPDCANGLDDDGDGDVDYPDDANCASASGASELDCASADAVRVFTGNVTGQSTGALANDADLTCGTDGRDDIWLLRVGAPLAEIRIDTIGSTIDTAIALRRASCTGFDLQCDDNSAGSGDSSLLLLDIPTGDYYVVVDDKNTSGTYNLNVRGVWAGGAACDPTSTAFRCGDGFTCTGPAGGATCTPVACNDAIDEDGDGFPGFPSDPGCVGTDDDDESDTCPGTACPACADDVDNDGDGFTDYPQDPGCGFAAQTTELAPCTSFDPVLLFTQNLENVTTIGSRLNDTALSCGTNGRDEIYRLNVPHPLSELHIDTIGSPLDTVVGLRVADCGSSDLACDDNGAGSGDSQIDLTNVSVGEYFIIVEDRFVTGPGAYNLTVRGTLQVGGACDPSSLLFFCPTAHACIGAPGAETCEPAACNDTIDQDGDGLPGYPSDPGCTSVSDPDESDDCPTGASCPACSNDVDDDGDGWTDYPVDPGCLSASDTGEIQCSSLDPVLDAQATITGASTSGRTNDFDLSCGSDGRDEVYRVAIDRPVAELRADTIGSALDTVVAIRRTDCTGSDLVCDDNGAGNASVASVTSPAAGEYYIIVDDRNLSSATYNLNVRAFLPVGASCDPSDPLFVCQDAYRCAGAAGAETCIPGVCNDAVDEDGDGAPGYPTDPGCTSIADPDENDDCPSGPNCPICSDDVDNDNDGFTDYPDDPTCASAADTVEAAVCVSADPIRTFTGNVSGAELETRLDDVDLSCGSDLHDEIYRLIIRSPLARLRVDTAGSTMDNAIALRRNDCGGATDVVCHDGSSASLSMFEIQDVPPGEYFLIIDDELSGSSGTYNLNVLAELLPGAACDPADASFVCGPGYACQGAAGAETCQEAACNDAVDADGDGHPGYPTDPGCRDPSDNDEADTCPTGPGCPACSNGLDDDNDGLTDYPDDFGCAAAGGEVEVACPVESDAVVAITQPITTGTTSGSTNDFRGACASSSHSAPDKVHTLALPVPVATLTVDTDGTSFDTTLVMTDVACAAEIECDDDDGAGTQSLITRTNVPAGNYAFVVDGFSSGSGTYQLQVRGTVAHGTACTSPLFASGVLACPIGTTCNAGVCQ